MSWNARGQAVTLQLGLAALVAGAELAVGPTLPPCATRPTMPPGRSPPVAAAPPEACAAALPLAPLSSAPQGAMPDEAAWREILELRREHGTLLNGAIWQAPDTPNADGDGMGDAAGWEEAAFGQALRQVMDAAAPR
ncbi:MAG: hypothetical protein MUF48_04890 [Pirellulaceae bacterium]|nr:hypothetical protein [Pirellulaceae bacterium]